MTRVEVGPAEDPCRFRHMWVPTYRWVWSKWRLHRRMYEICWDCEATRGR